MMQILNQINILILIVKKFKMMIIPIILISLRIKLVTKIKIIFQEKILKGIINILKNKKIIKMSLTKVRLTCH